MTSSQGTASSSRTISPANLSEDSRGPFELKSGNLSVASIGGKRYFRRNSDGEFAIILPEVLPQRFTMEFDLAGSGGWYQDILFASDEDPYYVTLRPEEDGGLGGPDGFRVVAAPASTFGPGIPAHIQIMADGPFVKVYMNGSRVANAPNAKIGRSKRIRFRLSAAEDAPVLIGGLRIAAGGKDLYRALNEDGAVTAEGILFDNNSDRIRPESEGVLKEIAELLKSHSDLKLEIAGHTDNTGQDDANLTLSNKRAAAVKAWLVSKGSVTPDRLDAKGYGSSNPAASNESPEGRQTNRRVELIKL